MENKANNDDVQDTAQRGVVVAPPITPPGKRLTEEERLTIENIYLKIQNAQMQITHYDTAKGQLIVEMRELQQKMENHRAALSAKYGVDIGRTTVTPSGEIKG